MKKALTAITFFDVVFLLLLSVSGSIGGTLGTVAHYFAFVIPLFLAFIYVKNNKPKYASEMQLRLLPDLKSTSYVLPLIAPFIAVVLAISFLTSLLLTSLGFSDSTDVSGPIFSVIIEHALIPSVLEELLFRFVPIMLLLPYSKKCALVIPSVVFACVHCNLFQIPYAALASFLLSYIAIATGSVFPCMMVHFLNNLASIIFMRNSEALYFNAVFFPILAFLCLVSVAFIIWKHKKYKTVLQTIKEDKCKVEFTSPLLLFIIMTLLIGVLNLWTSL